MLNAWKYNEDGTMVFGNTETGQMFSTAPTPPAIEQAQRIDLQTTGSVQPLAAYAPPPKLSLEERGAMAMNGAGGASAGVTSDVAPQMTGGAGMSGVGRQGTGNPQDAAGANGATGAGPVAAVAVPAADTSSGIEGIVKPSPAANRGATGVNTPGRAKEKQQEADTEKFMNATDAERSAMMFDKAAMLTMQQKQGGGGPVTRAERLKHRKIETEGAVAPKDSNAIVSDMRDLALIDKEKVELENDRLAQRMTEEDGHAAVYDKKIARNARHREDSTREEEDKLLAQLAPGKADLVGSFLSSLRGEIDPEGKRRDDAAERQRKEALLALSERQLGRLTGRFQQQAAGEVAGKAAMLQRIERIYQIQALRSDSPEARARAEKMLAETRLAQDKLVAEHHGKIKTTVDFENAIVGGGGSGNPLAAQIKQAKEAGELFNKANEARKSGDGSSAPIVIGDTAYAVPKNLEPSSVHELRKDARKADALHALIDKQIEVNNKTGWVARQAAKLPFATDLFGVGAESDMVATQLSDAMSQVVGMGGVSSEQAAKIMRGVQRNDPEAMKAAKALANQASAGVAKQLQGNIDAAATAKTKSDAAAIQKTK